jgi:apolipoprotein N-acyltransferase
MFAGYVFLAHSLVQTTAIKAIAFKTFLFFFAYFSTGLYWISSSLFIDLETWWWALPFSFMGLPVLLSLFPTIIVGLTGLLPQFRGVAIIIALILADIARGHMLTGFPWNMPAHIWVKTDIMMATLPYIGLYGLNTLTIILFCVPALFLNIRAKMAYVIILISLLFIPLTIQKSVPLNLPDNIIMVQANIKQQDKWDADKVEANFNKYISLSNETILKSNEPVLILWPETAISQNLLSYPKIQDQFIRFLRALPEGSHLLTGYLNYDDSGFYNSFAIFDRSGEITSIYDKYHLVPFGEYMPFGLDTLTGFSNFQNGKPPETIPLNAEQSILPLICYEIIFPRYATAAKNSDIIINITNDAWFGDTAGPFQHFDHAIFRAIENQVPVIRLSGNGMSGIITPSGKVISRSKLNSERILTY